jgi:hypothetical protein
MATRIPLMHKTPFVLDKRPLREASSPHAGLLATSRAFRSLGLPHDEGGRGYQPMVAVWAEADVVLADEFRDGNVPARQAPLACARAAATCPASASG